MSSYPRVASEAETIERAHDGMSLARFGDGELKICRGGKTRSQQHHPVLSRMLCEILLDTSGPCVPCIPRIRKGGPKYAFWKPYAGPEWTQLYREGGTYGSSLVTRPDSAPEIDTPEYWRRVFELWEGRDVVLVRGSTKSLIPERMTGAASVEEIVGPNQHAWAEHKAIFARLRGEKRRVILCLGATATVLAWMLAHEGTHALDLGHVGMMTRKIGPDGTIGYPARNNKD